MMLHKGALLDAITLGDDIDLDGLQQTGIDWQVYPQTTPQQLLGRIDSCDVVITNKVMIDADTLAQCPSLRLICVAATGTNNIDLEAAAQHGITVTNVTRYATSSVVQHVMTCMLMLTTRMLDYREALKQRRWQRSEMFCLLDYPITELADRTLGIIGYGELGRGVAAMARLFGMQVIVAESLTGTSSDARIPLAEVLRRADIVSLHCPLSAASANLLNAERIATMKPGAFLINTARGGIVDEVALLHALQSGHLGGAAVDVLAVEPPGEDSPLLQTGLPNLIVTPHIAWASHSSRQRLINEVIANIQAYEQFRPRNSVL